MQGFVQTIIGLIRGGFLSIYSLIRGVFSFAFGIVEHLAGFVGSSFNFVLCEFPPSSKVTRHHSLIPQPTLSSLVS